MYSLRPALRVLATRAATLPPIVADTGRRGMVISVKKALIKAGETQPPEDVPAVERRLEQMAEKDPAMIYDSGIMIPDPVLPEDPSEVAALDPADKVSKFMPDGRERLVVIRQLRARPNQSPLNPEKIWTISFSGDGSIGERWKNPLMGWNSTGDTYGCDPPLHFENATQAVYFAKKRGWKYIVKEPVIRTLRDDEAQYQDNFLPQAVANKVKKEGKQCNQWERNEAGSSHYFRPLKYHGDGVVRQHGPNMMEDSAPHVEGYYKMR